MSSVTVDVSVVSVLSDPVGTPGSVYVTLTPYVLPASLEDDTEPEEPPLPLILWLDADEVREFVTELQTQMILSAARL